MKDAMEVRVFNVYCIAENSTVSMLQFLGFTKYTTVIEENFFLRKYTLEYFEVKRHNVYKLLLTGSEKIKFVNAKKCKCIKTE